MLGEPLLVCSRLAAVLDALEIRYSIGGSLASSIHGVPRATQDADVAVALLAEMAAKKKNEPKTPRKEARRQVDRSEDRPRPEEGMAAALSALEAADREGAQAYDRKYEAIGEIIEHDPALFLAGGMSTLGAFVAKYLPNEDVRRPVDVTTSPTSRTRVGASARRAAETSQPSPPKKLRAFAPSR